MSRQDVGAWPNLAEATAVWARIAAQSFGGPAGQIAVMHRILVEERRWISDARFLHALNFCMLLPGPEAQQLASYVGWLMHGIRGALIAGGLFILPGALAILGLSMLYAAHGDAGPVAALFFGLKAAVLAIVAQAVVRIGRRALRSGAMRMVALAAFVAIFAVGLPFPLIVLGAALIGYGGARARLAGFGAAGGHGGEGGAGIGEAETLLGAAPARPAPAVRARATRAGLICLALWLLPVAGLVLAGGGVFADLALFFSKLAVITFGGAYAVLAWVAQEAVGHYGWLAPGEMLDGLGLAETTPGPLIMVTQFVGFLAAFRDAGALPAMLAGTLGALITTWVTFLPCFAWIFLGAPHMEALRGNRALGSALGAVTAAVVGVVANLALWFALHVIFAEQVRFAGYGLRVDLPVPGTLDPVAAGLTLLTLGAVFGLRAGTGKVLIGAALAGLALHAAGLA